MDWLQGETVVPEPRHTPTPEEVAHAARMRESMVFSTSSTMMVTVGGAGYEMNVVSDPNVPKGMIYLLDPATLWPPPVDEGIDGL